MTLCKVPRISRIEVNFTDQPNLEVYQLCCCHKPNFLTEVANLDEIFFFTESDPSKEPLGAFFFFLPAHTIIEHQVLSIFRVNFLLSLKTVSVSYAVCWKVLIFNSVSLFCRRKWKMQF